MEWNGLDRLGEQRVGTELSVAQGIATVTVRRTLTKPRSLAGQR